MLKFDLEIGRYCTRGVEELNGARRGLRVVGDAVGPFDGWPLNLGAPAEHRLVDGEERLDQGGERRPGVPDLAAPGGVGACLSGAYLCGGDRLAGLGLAERSRRVTGAGDDRGA